MNKNKFLKTVMVLSLVVPSIILSNSSASANSNESSIDSKKITSVPSVNNSVSSSDLLRATWGETGMSPGVSSASTNRVKVKSKMKVVINNYTPKKGSVKVTIFKSGSAWYTYYVSSKSDVTLKGSGDFSVRIYNNSAKNLKASATIQGS